jgi:type II secretory pathway component PulF
MVRSGEISGNLEDVLARLSDLLEFQMKTREIIKSATRYPIFVLVTLAIAFVVLIRVVVPKFVPMFRNAKIDLPLPTQLLLVVNDTIQNYGALVIDVILALVAFFYYREHNPAL